MSTEKGFFILSNPVLVTSVNLVEPVRFDKTTNRMVVDPEKGQYRITVALDAEHPQLAEAKAIQKRLAAAKWPKNMDDIKWATKSGTKEADKRETKAAAKDKEIDLEYLRGKVLISAHTGSKYPPILADGRKDMGKVLDPKIFYSGCKVQLEIKFATYEQEKEFKGETVIERGITTYLQTVVFAAEGERLAGSGLSLSEKFGSYYGKVSDENPLDTDEMVV